jgi:hypothetical protein
LVRDSTDQRTFEEYVESVRNLTEEQVDSKEKPVMSEVNDAIKEGISAVNEGRSPEEAIAKIFGTKQPARTRIGGPESEAEYRRTMNRIAGAMVAKLEDEGYSEHVKSTFIYAAERIVYNYVKNHLEKTDTHITFGPDEVYVVWFSKTLQHWKALVSTTLPDGMYYEVTHNGDKGETYLDAYKKFDNAVIPDELEMTTVFPDMTR